MYDPVGQRCVYIAGLPDGNPPPQAAMPLPRLDIGTAHREGLPESPAASDIRGGVVGRAQECSRQPEGGPEGEGGRECPNAELKEVKEGKRDSSPWMTSAIEVFL